MLKKMSLGFILTEKNHNNECIEACTLRDACYFFDRKEGNDEKIVNMHQFFASPAIIGARQSLN